MLSLGAGLAHYNRDGIEFDYPASWQVTPSNVVEHYSTVLAFLGTGHGSAHCDIPDAGGANCGSQIAVEPGQLEIEIDASDGPPRVSPIDASMEWMLAPHQHLVTVGGLPAIAQQVSAPGQGADLGLWWEIQAPLDYELRYDVTAYLTQPDLARQHAQVEALIASFRFASPPPPLDPEQAATILKTAVDVRKAIDPALACFPDTTGRLVTAVVAQLTLGGPLTQRLSVTCSAAIEPTAIGFWKVSLAQSWNATAGAPAGRLLYILWRLIGRLWAHRHPT